MFTPDEEVGRGVDGLDVDSLMADFGYTIDGDEMGGLESETFNAAGGDIQITGFNCHPGYAKGKMINAIRILADVIQNFPIDESPETTEKKTGYYRPYESSASVNEAKLKFIIRDFDCRYANQALISVDKNSDNITILNCEVSFAKKCGITSEGQYVTIRNNYAYKSEYGIFVFNGRAFSHDILSNTVNGCGVGIYVGYDKHGHNIKYNICFNNTCGMRCARGDPNVSNTIAANYFYNTVNGIEIAQSSNNIVIQNICA